MYNIKICKHMCINITECTYKHIYTYGCICSNIIWIYLSLYECILISVVVNLNSLCSGEQANVDSLYNLYTWV